MLKIGYSCSIRMAGNNNKESEPQNKQSLKTTLAGFAKRVESFTQMPEDSPNIKGEATSIIGFLNNIVYQKRLYFREKYGLGCFDSNDNKIKKILKKEDFVNEQDPPEEVRQTAGSSNKSILKITYPFGQKYFLGFKKNEKEERILYFVSEDKDQQRIVSFKFRVLGEGKKFLFVKARVYKEGDVIREKKILTKENSTGPTN